MKSQQQAFERPLFFHGQLLSLEEFQLLSDHPHQKRKRIHRLIHGKNCRFEGLDITQREGDLEEVRFTITAGYGLDRHGNEIHVPVDTAFSFKVSGEMAEQRRLYINLFYDELHKSLVPALEAEHLDEDTCRHSRIEETYRLEISPQYREEGLSLGSLIYNDKLGWNYASTALTPVNTLKHVDGTLSAHTDDKQNPHTVTALQAGALRSINGISSAEKPEHQDVVIANTNDTLEIKTVENRIQIEARPAEYTLRVEKDGKVGESTRFAREDHVHELAEGLVEARHLDPNSMVSPDETIQIEREQNAVALTVNRAALFKHDVRMATGRCSVKARALKCGYSDWQKHPFGPYFVQINASVVMEEEGGLLFGDMSALPKEALEGPNKYFRMGIHLDVSNSRFRIYIKNIAKHLHEYHIHWWVTTSNQVEGATS